MKRKIKCFLSKLGYHAHPEFMIVGVQKAGTSALFTTLNQHSSLIGSDIKEIHFFDDDQWYSEGKLYQYHSFFSLPFLTPPKSKHFEATPKYLFHPKVAKRLYDYNPALKMIVLIRNPAERAFSAWTMYHHHFKTGSNRNFHDPRSFTEAISEELQEIEQSGFDEKKRYYIKRGIYHYQIENLLNYFPKSQLLIIESNKLKNDFKNTSKQIQAFVDVPYQELSVKESNQSKVDEKHLYQADIQRLKDFYEPYNHKLFRLLDTKFDWNK